MKGKEKWILVQVDGLKGGDEVTTVRDIDDQLDWLDIVFHIGEVYPEHKTNTTVLTEQEKNALKAILSIRD